MLFKKRKKAEEYKPPFGATNRDKALFLRGLVKSHQSGGLPQVSIYRSDYKMIGNEGGALKAVVSGAEILAFGDPEAYLLANLGDGSYRLLAIDKDINTVAELKTDIGDVREKKEKKKSGDDEEKKSSKKSSNSDLVPIITAQIAANAEIQKAYMQSIVENRQKSDDGDMRQLLMQVIIPTLQNALSPQSSLDELLKAKQILTEFGPTLQPANDNLTSLLTTGLTLLGQAITARSGGGQLSPQLLQQLQSYIPQLQGQALPPGQTQAQPQTQGQLSGAQQQPQPTQQPQPQTPPQDISKSSNDEHRRFYFMYIDKIRRAITSGEPDYDVAKKIIDMMEYSVDYMRNDPHPIVAGMVRNMGNAIELNAELFKFFDSIPELAGLKEKQTRIQKSIIEIYTGGPVDDADNADVGDADKQDSQADPDGQLEDDPGQLP